MQVARFDSVDSGIRPDARQATERGYGRPREAAANMRHNDSGAGILNSLRIKQMADEHCRAGRRGTAHVDVLRRFGGRRRRPGAGNALVVPSRRLGYYLKAMGT